MKVYKAVIIAISLPLLAYSVLGNIYAFLFTYKELKNGIEAKYGGDIEIVGYDYDASAKATVFHIKDNDGVKADFVYNGKTNTFFDGYSYISSRVSYYTVRGNILGKIISSGVIPEDVDVIYKVIPNTVNKTAEEKVIPEEVMIRIKDKGDKNVFCDKATNMVNTLKNNSIPKIFVISDDFMLSVTDGMISSDKNDIFASIKPVYG